MGPAGFNVYDMICRNAQIYPHRECLVCGDTRVTFEQYREQCDRLASGLAGLGIQKGDRMGVVAQNSAEYMNLYGAAARLGAVLLPVNWRAQPDEMEYILLDGAPRLVLAGPEYLDTVGRIVHKIKSVTECYAMGKEDAPDGFLPFHELMNGEYPKLRAHAEGDAGYVIIHTAAVEGRPKGALLSQSNIVFSNLQLMYGNGLGPEDCFICLLPLFHIAALSMAMAVMHAGGKNVIMERFDPGEALRLIQEESGTVLMHFAPILKMLTAAYEESGEGFDLSSLRNISGLDSPENILAFKELAPHAKFGTGFAQTEAYPVTGCFMEERPGSAGRPSALARVAILDDQGREVAAGEPGEICVRSPVVFLGYWGREQDSAHTLRDGWHHTGDMGRLDEEGYLWYEGRKPEKELIKPGGENVYPAEVEKAILEHEKVAEACVIGVPDEQWGEAVKAVCALKTGETLAEEELIEFVAARIARYKKPKYVDFVDSLPRTEAGAINRERIKKEHGGQY